MPVINPGETVAERNQRLGFGTIAPKDTNLVYTSGEKSPTPGQEQILGPYTPPAPSPTENPDPTIGDVYSGYVPGENTELNDAESAYLKMLKEQTQPVDEEAIRRKTQEQFQAEIDAVNRVFAEKKAEEARVGQGRIGSGTAVQARRGLLGSTFGEAQKERVVGYNQSIQDAIQAEQQLQLASIMKDVRQSAIDEAAAKTLARQQGAVAYVEFLRGQADRKQQRVSDAITNVLNSDTEPSEDLFATLAKELGVSVDIIKSQYNSAKKANDKANAKEAVKGIEVNGSIIDPVTGDVIYQGTPGAEKPNTIGNDKTGYYEKDPKTGAWTQVIAPVVETTEPGKRTHTTVKTGDETFIITYDEQGNEVSRENLGAGAVNEKKAQERVVQLNTIDNKISLIDELLNDPALKSAVGPNGFARNSFGEQFTNKKGNFIAKVDQLIDKETLNTLLELKNAGGTLGAISEKELSILQNSATALSGLKALDDKSPGFETTETFFREQLQKIKDSSVRLKEALDTAKSETSGSLPNQEDVQYLMDNYGYTEQEANASLGFNPEGQTSLKGNELKLAAVAQPDGKDGGQCGRFVNKLTGMGLGDSYASKMAKMDKSIKVPAPGMVFTMPIAGNSYGHTGIIISVKNGIATVKDSNWYEKSAPETIATHDIPVSLMTGFAYPTKVIT